MLSIYPGYSILAANVIASIYIDFQCAELPRDLDTA